MIVLVLVVTDGDVVDNVLMEVEFVREDESIVVVVAGDMVCVDTCVVV